MHRLATIFVMISALALGACGAGRAVSNAGGGLFEARQGACPLIGILADANRITLFNGPGRDLPNIQYSAEITDVSTRCDYGRVGSQRFVYSRVQIDAAAQLGSAARGEAASIPYFVAIVERSSQAILTKEVFQLNAPFTGDRRAMRLDDNIDRIAIPVETVADGGFYEIIIGFELTADQLDYNRRREEF